MARKPKTSDAPENLVVQNTQACAIFLPPVPGYATQMLLPGQNDVPREHYEAAIATPGMRQYAAMGYVEVLQGAEKAKPIPRGLDGMADSDVKDRLAAMDSVRELQALRDLTTSAELNRLVNGRIKELTAGPGDSDDARDEG